MNNVFITGYGIVLRDLLTPEALFTMLANGKTLICEDRRLKSMGIENIPSAALSELDRRNVFEKLRRRGIFIKKDSVVQAMAYSSIIDAMVMSNLSRDDLLAIGPELFFANNKLFPSIDSLFNSIEMNNESSLENADIETRCKVPMATDFFNSIARYFHSLSPPRIYSDACTAGMSALNSAFLSIRHGDADVAIVCASEEATDPIMQLLFKKVGALYNGRFSSPKEASRAFDKSRAGCVLADASACLILESESHAYRRKVKPLAEIKGMYRNAEAYKMTSSDEAGVNYLTTMINALSDASMAPEDIDHINAHGTSTISNDQTESRAIFSLFKSNCPPVISTKSALGHSLGVSGLLECIISCESILRKTILPSINFDEQGIKDGKILINTSTKKAPNLNSILSNSFGFGGENCSIVLTKIKECV